MSDVTNAPQQRTRLSRRDMALLFYVGVPTAFGLSLGWQGAGMMAGNFSKPVSILYWLGASNVVWLTLDITTRAAAMLSPKGRTPLIILVLAGGILQPVLGRPTLSIWQSLFLDALPSDAAQPTIAFVFRSFADYGDVLLANTFIIGVWIAFNFLFDRFLRFPRFRNVTGYAGISATQDGDSEGATSAVTSGLLLRLPAALGKDVVALSAEDHYVRVYTKAGNDLILYRFSDAVREMPDGMGLQVHRSHWVSLKAITSFEEAGRGYKLKIGDSVEIPVSQRYIEVLKGRGITPS